MNENEPEPRLEPALRRTEQDVDASLKAVKAANKALKRLKTVISEGNLREVKAAFTTAEQAVSALQQSLATTSNGWDFDEAAYFGSGAYTRELLETANQLNVRIFEQDDRLYCYPSLVRVLPSERTVLIDRTRERRLRPSFLVEHLRALQQRPARFKTDAFLESLYGAYRAITRRYGPDGHQHGRVEPLSQVYELLTLLPGQRSDYSRQEFARDLYLLDRSGVTRTRDASQVSFPASTGTKSATGVFAAMTESGQERLYWGIAFSQGA